MVLENGDILVDIPDEDLTELYRKYEDHLDWAPQVCCAIDQVMKWRKETGDDSMIFMSPNNSWREDGTFILLMQISDSSYDIFVFTLDDECKNLYEGLMKTKRIDYRRKPHVLFFNIHDKHYPTVKKVLESKTSSEIIVLDTDLLSLSKEEALSFSVNCPPEVYIDGLKLSDAAKVNEYWPHHYPGSVTLVEAMIKNDPGVGLYLKSSNELVAWILLGPLGQISLLQVVDEHQRKGYAAIVTKFLSKRIVKENNQIPYGTALTKNAASLNLLRKINYKFKGLTHYVFSINES